VSGTGGYEFSAPYGVAFDGAGHLGVVEHHNRRVQVLNNADGSHVRTIGSNGSGNRQFNNPYGGIVSDADGRIVCDSGNHRIQVLQ
jgi:hypothetical protein